MTLQISAYTDTKHKRAHTQSRRTSSAAVHTDILEYTPLEVTVGREKHTHTHNTQSTQLNIHGTLAVSLLNIYFILV